jgi:alpha-1,3-rhamnosyl/mannosyltransferase
MDVSIRTLHPLEPFQVGALLRAHRPDLYYSPYFLMPIGAPCPSIVTIHDVWPLRMPEGLSLARHLVYRACLQLARGARFIYTSSEFSRNEIVSMLGFAEKRVRCIRLGVPPSGRVASPIRPSNAPSAPFALVVGDNRPRKNLRVLAQAWARMGSAAPVRLVIAGPEDPRYPTMRDLASAAGAHGIHSLGWVSEGELDWLYSNATLVLFPSRYEGFGFPLVEAFERGLPVVASGIPTLREIGEGVARFVDPDDVDAWAASVTQLATDSHARALARQEGLLRAKHLSYAATADATLRLFREATRG